MKKLLIVLCTLAYAGTASAQQAPVIQSTGFTDVTETTAVIFMEIIPNDSNTVLWVQYGPTAAVSESDTVGVFSGFSPIYVTDTLDSLPCNAYCFFEIRAQNMNGGDISIQKAFFVPPCLTTAIQSMQAAESHLTISPMPIIEHAVINDPSNTDAPFFIYDMNGRLVSTIPIINGKGIIEKGLPAGMYFYECRGQTGKIVVSE